jgi:hypothetical protein
VPTSDYTPDLADVGALITARTKDANGNEAGTFTTSTRPTADQVDSLIGKAVGRLSARIGSDIDASLFDAAKEVAALDVASRVELSFFPDQVAVGRTPYQELVKLHDTAEAELLVDLAAVGAVDGEDELSPAGLPRFGFPADAGAPLLGGSETGNPDVLETEWM